jgi:hypothetical protein
VPGEPTDRWQRKIFAVASCSAGSRPSAESGTGPDDVFVRRFFRDAVHNVGGLPLQGGFLPGCPVVVPRHGLQLEMKHDPGHRHIESRRLYPNRVGQCVPAASTQYSGFHFCQLRSALPSWGFTSVLITCMPSRVPLMCIADALGPLIDRQQDALHPSDDGFFRFGLRAPNGAYCVHHLFFSGTLCGLQVT